MVLFYYPGPHFEVDEKPKGDPWKSKIFLLRGVNEKGWRGVRSLLKPPYAFLINKKLKIQNLPPDNQEVPSFHGVNQQRPKILKNTKKIFHLLRVPLPPLVDVVRGAVVNKSDTAYISIYY